MLVPLAGCKPKSNVTSVPIGKELPVFSLAWSEYPSWSVFGVAHEAGLIDKEKGKLGSVEKKYNVDIVLDFADYDPCLQLYGAGSVDAVCITNMDIVGPAASKPSVVLFPTSTSAGADACIVNKPTTIDDLKTMESYGLERTVSQYCFERVLQKRGLDPTQFPFTNMDPGAAAQLFQAKDANTKSIVVWNPFVMQTLKTRSDAKVLFDSSEIPQEIVDMVVASKEAMKRDGSDLFAMALMEAFYEVSRRIDDPKTADQTLVALGEKFSKLDAAEMRTVVTQTKFYKTPDAALALLNDKNFRDTTMPTVIDFCKDHQIIELKDGEEFSIGFDAQDKQLDFSTAYLEAYKNRE